MGQAERHVAQIRPKAVRGVIFGLFSNVDNFRQEVSSDVMSGVVVDPMGVKVCVKFGEFRSNRLRDIRLPLASLCYERRQRQRRPTDPMIIRQNAVA